MTDFDYPTWAAQGRANADKLPSAVAEALGPERDWADQLADGWYTSGSPPLLADYLRSRCLPIGEVTVTDELVTLLQIVLDANDAYRNDGDWSSIMPKDAWEAKTRAAIAKATGA